MILDDASRMVLAGGEFFEINTENSKHRIHPGADDLIKSDTYDYIRNHGIMMAVVMVLTVAIM